MSRPDTQDFTRLFLTDTPMMDTRAPLEFKKGAFPHTVSLPLIEAYQRRRLGRIKQQLEEIRRKAALRAAEKKAKGESNG